MKAASLFPLSSFAAAFADSPAAWGIGTWRSQLTNSSVTGVGDAEESQRSFAAGVGEDKCVPFAFRQEAGRSQLTS